MKQGYYEEFQPQPRYGPVVGRGWIEQGGGLLAADAPTLSFEMMDMFDAAGLGELVSGYLGEPALISVHKTTLRKADPSVPGAWHQDGFFMGEVRSLNLWLSLSRCGDEAPGLDLLPRRLDHYLATNTEEAALDYTISQRKVDEAAGDRAGDPADLRAGGRAVLRRAVPAPDGLRSVDATAPVRDRELVLRRLLVPWRVRADRGLTADQSTGSAPYARRSTSAQPGFMRYRRAICSAVNSRSSSRG